MNNREKKGTLKEAYDKIKTLMAEERWQEAHRACLELLRFDSDNIKTIRLKNKIEKNVRNINIKAIEEDLDNLKPLWKEKKYEEILEHLKKLAPYIKDYPAIKTLIIKAQKGYKNEVAVKQKEYIDNEIASINKMLEERKFKEAMMLAEKLKKLKIHESAVKTTLQKIKTTWVETELSENSTLIQSEKYEDTLLFLQKLLIIDSQSQKVKQHILSIKKKNRQSQLEKKRDFIYVGLEKTRTLLQLRKYTEALVAAREILVIDPKNQQAQAFFRKANRKEEKQIGKEVIKQMQKSRKEIKKEYKEDKKKFLKL